MKVEKAVYLKDSLLEEAKLIKDTKLKQIEDELSRIRRIREILKAPLNAVACRVFLNLIDMYIKDEHGQIILSQYSLELKMMHIKNMINFKELLDKSIKNEISFLDLMLQMETIDLGLIFPNNFLNMLQAVLRSERFTSEEIKNFRKLFKNKKEYKQWNETLYFMTNTSSKLNSLTTNILIALNAISEEDISAMHLLEKDMFDFIRSTNYNSKYLTRNILDYCFYDGTSEDSFKSNIANDLSKDKKSKEEINIFLNEYLYEEDNEHGKKYHNFSINLKSKEKNLIEIREKTLVLYNEAVLLYNRLNDTRNN